MALYTVSTGTTVAATDLNQYYNLLTGAMTDQQVTVSNRIRAQLAGATNPSGYVGGTSSGAPTSGTFAAGDYVIDQTGCMWICITAGTPGTWKRVGTGGYVARVSQHANQNYGTTPNPALVTMDTVDYDPKSMWSAVNNWYSIPIAGTWQVEGRVSFQSPSNYQRFTSMLYKNGSEMARGFDSVTAPIFGGGIAADLQQFAVNDHIQLYMECTVNGNTESAQAPGARTWLTLQLVDV